MAHKHESTELLERPPTTLRPGLTRLAAYYGAIGSQQASQARGVLLDQVEAPEYQLEDAEQHRHNHGDAELPDPRRETDRDRGEDVYCVARLLEIVAEADRRYDTGQAERVSKAVPNQQENRRHGERQDDHRLEERVIELGPGPGTEIHEDQREDEHH